MTTGQFFSIDPQEFHIPVELKKTISFPLQLKNTTENHLAFNFQVNSTNPKRYCVVPEFGIMLSRSTFDLIVTIDNEDSSDKQCKDELLLQTTVTSPHVTSKDITPELFDKESGNQVEEYKLKVNYAAPTQSPVREGSDIGTIISFSSNVFATRTHKQSEEENSVIQQRKKHHEDEKVGHEERQAVGARLIRSWFNDHLRTTLTFVFYGILFIIYGPLVKLIQHRSTKESPFDTHAPFMIMSFAAYTTFPITFGFLFYKSLVKKKLSGQIFSSSLWNTILTSAFFFSSVLAPLALVMVLLLPSERSWIGYLVVVIVFIATITYNLYRQNARSI